VSDHAVTADRCPLCDGPNDCGLIAGKTRCWCFDARISDAALQRVPARDTNRVCICQACATSTVSAPAPDAGDER
jgi:hypothetical protein